MEVGLFHRKKAAATNHLTENEDEIYESTGDVNRNAFFPLVSAIMLIVRWLLNVVAFGAARPLRWILCDRAKKRKTARVFVVESESSCDSLLQLYHAKYRSKLNFLGIDCEWVSTKDQRNYPVALLQISTPLRDCFLIRLCKMDGRLPRSVKRILENKSILKFGVGIQDDAKKLRAYYGVEVLGCVDLRHVVQRCRVHVDGNQQRNQKMSLDALASRILGVNMDKSWRVRCSNWEAEDLIQRQIEYAMNDALVASHMFFRMVQLKREERKLPVNDLPSEGMQGLSDDTSTAELVKGLSLEDIKDEDGTDSEQITGSNHDENSREDISNLTTESSTREHKSTPTFSMSSQSTLSTPKTFNQPNGNLGSHLCQDAVKLSTNIAYNGGTENCCKEQSDSSEATHQLLQSVDLGESNSDGLTVNVSKWESANKEYKGYLDNEEVTVLLGDPLFHKQAISLCQGIVDLAFKQKKSKNVTKQHKNNENHLIKPSGKPYKTGTIRKSPLYMNCMLAAPDGSRLCTLDRKKADWYIEKGIGELTCFDPYTVRLTFEPSGRPGTEDSYYLHFKDNICVVCGSDKSYMRKNIVPHDYRRYFPSVMKDHHSHDILLLCPECHCLSNTYDDQLRKELAKKYNAPVGNATMARLIEDRYLGKVKSAARALSNAGDKIPEKRHQELKQIVQEYFKVSELSPDLIREAANMDTMKENVNFVSHGQEVVKRIRSEGKLLEFEKMWRQNFLDTMQPQFLPPLWSVDHRHERLKQDLEKSNDL